MRKNENGFTLIELLIVVIILGILAVIGIPKFMSNRENAIVRSCATNRASLEDAGERYFFDVGSYPADQAAMLVALDDSTVTGYKGPYIKGQFYCPALRSNTYAIDGDNGAVSCSGYDANGSAVAGNGGHAKAVEN
jgi:type II secretion system protein G